MKYSSVIDFFKKEIVFVIATIIALISCFFIHPDKQYVNYVDFNTLFLLFSLMAIVQGLKKCNVFDAIASFLCLKVKTHCALYLILVLLCFFFSMLLTNDVALLTFVPFGIFVLVKSGASKKDIMLCVIFQTVAANLGSMMTPIGNPQNLFLFSKMNINVFSFMKILFPYTLVSLILILISSLFISKKHFVKDKNLCRQIGFTKHDFILIGIYSVLFLLTILSVAGIIPKWICALLVLICVLCVDRSTLKNVDYILLLTFVSFFVFTGNLQRFPMISDFLVKNVAGRETLVSIFTSQFISNVPSALLLYPFTQNVESLLVGVNLGGLGTLVASLASLISFKIYSANVESEGLISSGKYLLFFTIVNVIFLLILVSEYFLIR